MELALLIGKVFMALIGAIEIIALGYLYGSTGRKEDKSIIWDFNDGALYAFIAGYFVMGVLG